MLFAQIILPFPLAANYTYAVPPELEPTLVVGMRVVVPFGIRRFYTGIVEAISDEIPPLETIKSIAAQIDEMPTVLPSQLQFWRWMASYYRSSLGDVYRNAVPSALRLESETQVEMSADFASVENLTEKERRVFELLTDGKSHNISELNAKLGLKNCFGAVKLLLARGAVSLSEEVSEQFRHRTENVLRLADSLVEIDRNELLATLGRAKKQQQLLQTYFELSPNVGCVSRTKLIAAANATQSTCVALIERGILVQSEQIVSRLKTYEQSDKSLQLSENQQIAYGHICEKFKALSTVLLHGITASGKTEIYAKLASDAINSGRQVLFLVPEIALTTQLTERLKQIFGDQLGVYHSKFSEAERVEIWQKQLGENPRKIVIGARSALFLPFQNLGLIVVDEEHDASYKQTDTAPRFNARNAALMLAHQFGAKTILGSATPSVESYCHAVSGKFGLVELHERFTQVPPPEIVPIDMAEVYRRRQNTGHFSDFLVDKIRETIEAGEQVILFQNRRGYAPYVECKSCGWVPRCPHCDVSLTYHKHFDRLTCHYCGYTQPQPAVCPDCQQPSIKTHGFGTEQIEHEITPLFPNARVARMDLDSTRRKNSYERLIAEFENRDIDILIGTQMVAKGLDFANVGLVGILNADNLLNYPDFRAHERAFQLLTQVSGRAGRSEKRGLVVLQTSQPQHAVIQRVLAGNYRAFFDAEMTDRQLFDYPPYCRLLQIELRHRDAQTLNKAAYLLAKSLRNEFHDKVLGPDNPTVGRVQNQFIKHILLKIDIRQNPENAKIVVDRLIANLKAAAEFRMLQIAFDTEV